MGIIEGTGPFGSLGVIGRRVPVNRYVADGLTGVDCDGPFHVLPFAVPVLLLYGAAAMFNAQRHREPLRLLVALVCTLACAAVAVNAADAVALLNRNATENAGSSGDQP